MKKVSPITFTRLNGQLIAMLPSYLPEMEGDDKHPRFCSAYRVLNETDDIRETPFEATQNFLKENKCPTIDVKQLTDPKEISDYARLLNATVKKILKDDNVPKVYSMIPDGCYKERCELWKEKHPGKSLLKGI